MVLARKVNLIPTVTTRKVGALIVWPKIYHLISDDIIALIKKKQVQDRRINPVANVGYVKIITNYKRNNFEII